MTELEEEAKRRCLAAGYSTDLPARALTSFPANDARPLWRAHYLPEVLDEDEAATPIEHEKKLLAFVFLLVASPALIVLGAIFLRGGWF